MAITENWRLILNSPHHGAWNMAVDEALLESISNHDQPPTLRLYDWQPYTLSIGLAQPAGDVNLSELQNRGWDLVRRPTGGRAILHADEMTYSVTAPIENPILRGNVIESYRRISTALVEALQLVGLCADSKPKKMEETHLSKDPVCFQFPSDYEITYLDKKVVGSAQARKKGGILQHGSIPLHGDITRIIEVLNYPNSKDKILAQEKLIERASTIEASLGMCVSWSDMADAMIRGFEEKLGITFIPGNLSNIELNNAVRIYREKYYHRDWTFRI
jgi:lipoate-protein ligase A